MYSVKEIFYTLQGEGAQSGRAAVFLRFAGCNLWTGREQDRETAICRFCDTDFVGTDGPGGGKFAEPQALADAVARAWPSDEAGMAGGKPYVVCTGGEPLLAGPMRGTNQRDEPRMPGATRPCSNDPWHCRGSKAAARRCWRPTSPS
jgi:organic radical activating enzyme